MRVVGRGEGGGWEQRCCKGAEVGVGYEEGGDSSAGGGAEGAAGESGGLLVGWGQVRSDQGQQRVGQGQERRTGLLSGRLVRARIEA